MGCCPSRKQDDSSSRKRKQADDAEVETELLLKKRRRKDNRDLGRVMRVLEDKKPPYGFIKPEGGGSDLYFNEHLLGKDLTWSAFLEVARKYDDCQAPVIFVKSKSAEGHARAENVVPLSREQLKQLDKDGDSCISRLEALQFFEAHPDLGLHTEREVLYKKQQEAEEELWKQSKALHHEGERLWREGEQLWTTGRKEEAKVKQQNAKDLHQQAQLLRQQVADLDRKHNEEMFEFVQENEHKGEIRDGTWIDLHGLSAEFAESKTIEFLLGARTRNIKHVLVITGAGIHSGRGGSAIKHKILSLLEDTPESLEPLSFDEVNAGAYRVTLRRRAMCTIA